MNTVSSRSTSKNFIMTHPFFLKTVFPKHIVFSYFVCFLLSLFWLSSCHLSQKSRSITQKKLTDRDSIDLLFYFYNANKEKLIGNEEHALGLFARCLQIAPANDASMYEIGKIYLKTGKFPQALPFLRSAAAIQPKNIWYQTAYADALQKNRMGEEAVAVYKNLLKEYPDQIDFYSGLANAYLYSGKIMDAIKIYDKLEEQIGINNELIEQKEKLYIKIGKIDKAAQEVQKLINAFPDETQYYLMLASLYQANNMNDKALEVYKKVQQLEPDNPSLHLSLAEFYRSVGKKEESYQELKTAFLSRELDINIKFTILSSYYSLITKFPELKEQAFTLSKILVEIHPEDSRSFAVYGDFLYQEKKYEEARTHYRRSLQLDKESFVVWQQLLLSEAQLNDYASMLPESEEALMLFPAQPIAYFFNGVSKIQAKQYAEAVTVLEQGIKLVADNNSLLAQFYSNLGDAQNKLKNYKKSDEAYSNALKIDEKNTYVLNNYSYYLSLRNDSLDKAAEMSRLSNELEPNNPSFLDTYAWILYTQKKYTEAKRWLEKSLSAGGDSHAVILEHYGDVLYQLGEKDKALEYWNNAKKTGTASELLDKKISEKRLIE